MVTSGSASAATDICRITQSPNGSMPGCTGTQPLMCMPRPLEIGGGGLGDLVEREHLARLAVPVDAPGLHHGHCTISVTPISRSVPIPAARGARYRVTRMSSTWRRPMGSRDASEEHRASTPLELLFDLCFVVAVARAASLLHHARRPRATRDTRSSATCWCSSPSGGRG